ncbi:MAG: wax ester/triacylglycerol synthase family O-acyltransferase [Dehalococcoidia bacterium]|nr:wax ester/triacylglycerol synthase family O-acyltransferase [Dehalococcoidia bacterium]
MDASFLYFEKPSLPLHIGSTLVLDEPLDRETLVSHIASRLNRIPRYRELAAFDSLNLAHPRWEHDPRFDVGRHIEEVTLPAGATEADFLDAIAQLHAQMLPRDRPLWKMILMQGLPGGGSSVTSLVHHCMVDGVSGIELLTAVCDLQRDVDPDPEHPFTPDPEPSALERSRAAWRDAAEDSAGRLAEALRWSLDPQQQANDWKAILGALTTAAPQFMQPAPATPFNRPVGPKRNYAYVAMPFGEIRGVRGALGGTINDVVLTALSGGLGAFLRGLGQETRGVELRAMVPVNVRSESDKSALGNQVSMLIAPLPVGIEDHAERHQAVIAGMDRLKGANQAGGFVVMSKLTEQVPAYLQALAANFVPNNQPLLNLICTNVPGPQIPLYLAGRKVEAHYPLVPLSMGLGMNVCLTSYNGVLYWGLVADPELVPDVGVIARHVEAAFEGLKAASMATA